MSSFFVETVSEALISDFEAVGCCTVASCMCWNEIHIPSPPQTVHSHPINHKSVNADRVTEIGLSQQKHTQCVLRPNAQSSNTS